MTSAPNIIYFAIEPGENGESVISETWFNVPKGGCETLHGLIRNQDFNEGPPIAVYRFDRIGMAIYDVTQEFAETLANRSMGDNAEPDYQWKDFFDFYGVEYWTADQHSTYGAEHSTLNHVQQGI
jgi:hypothetical protein